MSQPTAGRGEPTDRPKPTNRPFRPIGAVELVTELGDWLIRQRDATTARWGSLRVGLDGAPAAHGDELAADVVDYLQRHSVSARHVRADDFLRDASVRLEYGHEDLESYAHGWLDAAALRREVLDPLDPGRIDGVATVLRSLRDQRTNRATRVPPDLVAPDTIVILSGARLLNYDLPFEFLIHLALSEGALRRHCGPEATWTIPALIDYDAEQRPMDRADVSVRLEDPRRPAIRYRSP